MVIELEMSCHEQNIVPYISNYWNKFRRSIFRSNIMEVIKEWRVFLFYIKRIMCIAQCLYHEDVETKTSFFGWVMAVTVLRATESLKKAFVYSFHFCYEV